MRSTEKQAEARARAVEKVRKPRGWTRYPGCTCPHCAATFPAEALTLAVAANA